MQAQIIATMSGWPSKTTVSALAMDNSTRAHMAGTATLAGTPFFAAKEQGAAAVGPSATVQA